LLNEYLKEEIKIIIDKVSFLRNILLAIISGIVGVLFGITQNKIDVNFSMILLLIVGIIFAVAIAFRINKWEEKRRNLINKLKDVL